MNLNYCAVGFTNWLLTYSNTFRTVLGFASLIWTLDLTFRLFTFNFTYSVLGLLARSSTGGRLANRLTYGGTSGVIALPRT